MQEEPESRREWMLEYFQKSCEHLKKEQKHKVWHGGYHAEIVESNWFIQQKINYIHNNPVKEKIVTLPEDYYFSSARNYAGLDYELEILVLDLFQWLAGMGTECNSALSTQEDLRIRAIGLDDELKYLYQICFSGSQEWPQHAILRYPLKGIYLSEIGLVTTCFDVDIIDFLQMVNAVGLPSGQSVWWGL